MALNSPVSILTPLKVLRQEMWPGRMPVRIRQASNPDEPMELLLGTDVLISLVHTKNKVVGGRWGTDQTGGRVFSSNLLGWAVPYERQNQGI